MQLLIPAITVKAALAGFEALGLDAAELLAATCLTQSDLTDPFATVPNHAFAQIWMAAFQQMPDPTLPTRAGFAVPFNEFGILDHLVATANTIGEGLHMLKLFIWLVAVNLDLRFSHSHGDWVWVETDEPSGYISETWTLALILQRFRGQIGNFEIEEVHLSQADDLKTVEFERVWNVPVRLGQPHSGFRLKPGVWDLPNHLANPLLQQTLRGVAEQVEIAQFEKAPLVFAIRTRLPDAMESGAFSAEDIAAELGLSKRTLQRKLSAENITFKQLLDLYRQEQATFMLQSGERNMAKIAYALGYNEQSSFNRAFRRWFGQSPSGWLATA